MRSHEAGRAVGPRACAPRKALVALAPPAALVLATTLVLFAGCVPASGPPPIVPGTECAACGMEVRDLRFSCEQSDGKLWRVYDSIECLLAEPAAGTGGMTFLADYDRQALHRADSLWVVKGEFASPMGGGYAAFLDLAAADSIAAATRGRVDRLAAFLPPRAEAGR